MKKLNKKAFTLIELLAVILILGIIALIAIPTITNIIEEAKKGSAKTSVLSIINAIDNVIMTNEIKGDVANNISNGIYTIEELMEKGLTIKGKTPTSGVVTVLNSKITSAEISYDKYEFIIDEDGNITDEAKVYGLRWDGNNTYTRLEDAEGMTSCVGTDTIECTSDFDEAEIYKEMREVVVDGNQFIYIPKFYIKKVVNGDTWEWYISKIKQDENYYLPACFYDEENSKVLPYVLVGKYNASLESNKLISKTGTVPLTGKNINQFRTYARNNNSETTTGYQLMDIHMIDIVQVLFYIEFSTLDSQSIMRGYADGVTPWQNDNKITAVDGNNITLTPGKAASYKVDQLFSIGTSGGNGNVVRYLKITAVNGDVITVTDIPGTNRLANIAIDQIVWNSANINGMTDSIKAKSGSYISNSSGKYSMNYRGIENLYGNVLQFIDGVNINNDAKLAFVEKDATKYQSDIVGEPYIQIGYSILSDSGFVIKMGYDNNNPFIQLPTTLGAGGKYKDKYASTETGKTVMLYGGDLASANSAGISLFTTHFTSERSDLSVGSRLAKTPY